MTAKLSPLAISVAALFLNTSALAEEAPYKIDEVIEVKGRTFVDYKNDSATGAMRADMSMLETPQSVAVIPEIVIDERLATTLGEVLDNDSSVSAGSSKWNRQVFNLRGFEMSSGTGYLKDGQQVWSHFVHPIEILERVEVVKGPSSMLYGQSAPGGLINMVTKKPTHDRQLNLGFDTDEHGSTRFQMDASGALTESGALRGRAVVVKQDTKSWRQYQDGSDNERDRALGSFQLEGDLGDWGMLNVHYDVTRDKAGMDVGGWLDQDGNLIGGREQVWDMPWAFTDNEIQNYGADLTVYLSNDWQMKVGANHQLFYRQRFDSLPSASSYNSETGEYTLSPFDREDDWQFKTFYVDFTGTVDLAGMEHNLLFGMNGVDYFYQTRRDRGSKITVTPGQPLPPKPDLDFRNVEKGDPSEYLYYGIYFQDLITVNEQWQVLLGGRFDKMNKDVETKGDGLGDSDVFLPRAGLIFHPSENSSLYANYSESFEPQTYISNEDDKNFGQNLDPVMAKSVELGGKLEMFDERLLLTGAVFDITKSNIVLTNTQVPPGSDYTQITTQSGEQRHKGAEMSASGQASEKWFVMGSVMWLDAKYVNHNLYQGNRPIDAPEFSGNAWTRYQASDELAFNLGLTYVGERYANLDNTIKKDAYTRIDLGASYKMPIGDQQLAFRVNLENLLDKKYLGGGSSTDVTVGEGRNIRASVSYTF
ncbi:TonB-dependent siderophore receptor [Paraferrimonas sedimenticola]|uniref:TonB-dependent receptor n=1 Tax=Paraferrimonas sedimenticola TaxID=375674 RepID=A0AA37VUC9_9GAMM|nr:TonB-dependent receptor [Paraferrimonas sedimenticola]GLP95591.1 TonB-dependent receptor [Paraferrimonas sedimenticola]